AIYMKDGKKHVETFAYSSEWTALNALSVLVLGQHKYKIGIHHWDRKYIKLSEMKTLADYNSAKEEAAVKIGYRCLNPDPTVPTVLQGDAAKAGAVGYETTNLQHLASINVHYGGESLVVTDRSTAWSEGCQVIAGWDNYIRLMRAVESDSSLKG